MEFTRAKKGTKLMVIGEILLIAGLIATTAATVLMIMLGSVIIESEAITVTQTIATSIFMLSAGIAFAAQVLVIIGLIIASKDASSFRISLIFTILCVVCDTASGFLQTIGSIAVMIATVLSSAVFAAAVCFGLKGVASLGEKAENTAVADKGKKTVLPVIILTVLGIVLTVCGNVVPISSPAFAAVLSVTPSLLSVIIVILYITALKKVKRL